MVAGDTARRPRVLVTRPSADALPLAGALQRRGYDVLLQPLLRIEYEDGPPPETGGVQALLFTSANGVRAFARRSDLRTLPVYAVGDATASAARAEHFLDVASADGDVNDLAALVRDRLEPAGGRLLHIAGSAVAGDLAGALEGAGFTVDRLQLYTSHKTETFDSSIHSALAAGAVDAALFFSPRSAASFVSLVRDAALAEACRDIHAFALSAAVAEALSPVSWRAVAVAPEPTQESLLATLEREVTDTSTPDAPAAPASQPGSATDLLDTGNAEAVVDRFGGIRPMASKLGIPVTTVQGWRGRGHIPANRVEEIRRAAADHGVDLSAGAEAPKPAAATRSSVPPTERPTAETPAAAPSQPSSDTPPPIAAGGSGVAWAALILAVVALAGVASYRYWGPLIGGPAAGTPAALTARVAKLESAAADTSNPAVEALSRKVDTLSRDLAVRPSGGAENGKALATATAEIESLRASVEALSQKVGQADARARAAGTEAQDALDTLRGEVAALRKTVSDMDARVKAIEARPPATGGRIAALAVAAGQLESALDSGRPYGGALDRLRALAADDTALAAPLATLADSAATGVPTAAGLTRRFAALAPSLTVPVTTDAEAGGGWVAALRQKAMSLVNMRPVGDGGDASPVTRAERALARNDLSAAVAALEGVPAAAAWREAAQRRIDADAASGAIRARVVDRLAAETQAGETPAQAAGEPKRGTP